MTSRSKPFVVTCLVLSVSWLAGCTSTPPAKHAELTRSDELTDVGSMIREYQATNNRGPAKSSDLVSLMNSYPIGSRAIAAGDVVVVPGATMGDEEGGGREVVVAYEKKAPTDGGLVLLENGKVVDMSAAQFNSTPKGGK